jgi:riboflavin transporter FmnP
MNTKKIVYSAMFVALGILLPMIFHSFNMGGQVFLPMHIPVLIAGMFLGPLPGLLVGITTPILSSLLTGMPPMFPMLPIMIAELGIYGLSSGYIAKVMDGKTLLPLAAGMIDGRIAAGVVVLVLSRFFGAQLSVLPFLKAAIITGLPGILIQLIIIPPIIRVLRKTLTSPLT